MEDKLDFSLPQKKSKTSVVLWVLTALLLILLGVSSANFFLLTSGRTPQPAVGFVKVVT